MIFDSTVSGIPCRIAIETENEDLTFTVLDRRDRYAEWLERKLTASDDQRIIEECLAVLDAERFDAEYCAAEARERFA